MWGNSSGIVDEHMQHLTLISKHHRGDTVWSFQFKPAAPLVWTAGQFIRVALPHAEPDAKGTTRWFTIAAAPHEHDITITTRITGSSFKQALSRLEPGQSLELIEAPAGDFIWRESTHPHIFAAQGIGITPFYAIIKDRRHHGLPVNATLVYGHQPDAALIFQPELDAWATEDPSLHIMYEAGTLSAERTAQLAGDLNGRYIYVSGPKSFVSLALPPYSLPLSHLKQDNFPGYAARNY